MFNIDKLKWLSVFKNYPNMKNVTVFIFYKSLNSHQFYIKFFLVAKMF